ncbi:MAG: replicative DNA helicase [Chloroflexi bacterium]|jgi:replicative DNA helicase|nr:replicative DNA helicase [Chloroflexota bacterium]MBT7079924.1 replicative DNA helicase [Chloroflexota bacterium]MBT7289824.1 replicative DNA helicase [Chloroflexota bacterium]
MNNDRLPPNDVDAEEAVIGSLLIDSESMHKVAVMLSSGDFFRDKNRWAFQSCLDLHERNEAINQITVAQELAREGKLEALGGAAYLSHLVSQVPTSVHIEYYAQIVNRLSMMRHLIDAAERISTIGYEAAPDVDESMNRAEDILFRLRGSESPRDFVPIKNLLHDYFEENEQDAKDGKDGQLHSVMTGFTDIDSVLGGMQRSDMVVLGARPSMGKSSLALNIARNAAVDQHAKVAIFSLEMSMEQLVHRFLASEAGIDSKRIRLGQHNAKEERKIMDATGKLSEAQIFIDDSPFPSTSEIRHKAKRLQNEHGIDLLVVDYLQLVRSSGRSSNLVQEMSEISRSLKAIARDLSIPVLALSQLSRAVESRTPKIPQLADLRESGGIEQDADVVMFIYREEFYTTKEEWEMRSTEQYPEGKADLIIAKHRNGPTGKVSLYFKKTLTKFENSTKDRPQRYD